MISMLRLLMFFPVFLNFPVKSMLHIPLVRTITNRRPANQTAEFALRSYLMTNYRMVRPVADASESVTVVTRLFPIKIQELVEKEERLVVTVRVQLGWIDNSMSWNPSVFHNQTSVVLPFDVKVWLPELQIVNSAMDMYGIFTMRNRKSPVKAHYNGEVWWHPTGRMDVRCELNLMYFPFDFQRCGIILEPVVYTQDQLNLTLRPNRHPVTLSMYSENGLWKLVNTGGRQEVYWVSSSTGFSRVEFIIYLQRRTTYYKMNIIFPCILLSILQLLTFILPIDNDERVPQATTILLSVIVFQTVIVDQLPKSSTSMSLLAMYISTLVGISTATVASSIICSLFISLRPSCFQVPLCMEILARHFVTKATVNMEVEPALERHKSLSKRRSSTSKGWNSRKGSPGLDRFNSRKARMIQERSSDVNEITWRSDGSTPHHVKSFYARKHGGADNAAQTSQPAGSERRLSSQPSVFSLHERNDYTGSLRRHRRWSNFRPTEYKSCEIEPVPNETSPKVPKPPYVLVVDWCRMSHIINAGMFTLCLCLDVLVPSILFYLMPPIKPPIE